MAIIAEWMSTLPEKALEEVTTVMYDDMCHLAAYSSNLVTFCNNPVKFIL